MRIKKKDSSRLNLWHCHGELKLIELMFLIYNTGKNFFRYPDKLAWQLKLTRKHIRGSESFFKLHNFLISETESGNISRQEVVSMIPPIVLDIKSHHKVIKIVNDKKFAVL